MLSAKTKVCLVVGYPVDHSLSPAMHNAAYEALGIGNGFVYLGANTQSSTQSIVAAMRALGIRGYAVTMPHKVNIVLLLDWVDETAQAIGAVNTVVNENGVLKGYNTDWLGAVTSLKRLTGLKGKKVALIGAGGAARAIAFGLTREGAVISAIFNRTRERAVKLAEDMGLDCKVKPLEQVEEASSADIIVNATPIGMKGVTEDETPLPKECIKREHIIFDVVYSLEPTRFIREAREQGVQVVTGIDMVLYQAIEQFALHTGRQLTSEDREKVEQAMRGALVEAGAILS